MRPRHPRPAGAERQVNNRQPDFTDKYAVAQVLIADNDPFLAPVQKVYFGDGDLVAQSGSNGGMYVIKRTVADSYLTVNYTVTPTPNGPSGFTIGGGYGGNTSATFLPGISEVSVNFTMNNNAPATSGAVTVTTTPSANYEIMGSPSNSVAFIVLADRGRGSTCFVASTIASSRMMSLRS